MTVSKEKITSRQNRLAVDTWKLNDRKERTEKRRFRFDGVKLFGEAVEKGVTIVHVLIAESKADRVLVEVEARRDAEALKNATVHILADDVFSKISEERSPEGMITVAEFPPFHAWGEKSRALLDDAANANKSVLVLESVRDPGNVGTILRSAAAFGVGCVAMSADCADIYNGKTVRGAMGALFRMRITVFEDVTEAIAILQKKGRRVYAAALDPEAVKLTKSTLSQGDCVVIGNEGHGLSQKTVQACDKSLYIPMENGSESLNAAIAASVILWSVYGQ